MATHLASKLGGRCACFLLPLPSIPRAVVLVLKAGSGGAVPHCPRIHFSSPRVQGCSGLFPCDIRSPSASQHLSKHSRIITRAREASSSCGKKISGARHLPRHSSYSRTTPLRVSALGHEVSLGASFLPHASGTFLVPIGGISRYSISRTCSYFLSFLPSPGLPWAC